MELQPFADADESNFEAAEYGTVSALLGEGAKPFLGIPPGPLQVGHFIGALVIVLMAFVQYPGFPLTNLPTPVRDALQGGTSLREEGPPILIFNGIPNHILSLHKTHRSWMCLCC
jgi:hypothetical protein